MAARLVDKLPEGDDWLCELKWDGYRALLIKDGTSVEIRSRNDKYLSHIYPSIAEARRRLKARQAVLDGEIVALDVAGKPSLPGAYCPRCDRRVRIKKVRFLLAVALLIALRAHGQELQTCQYIGNTRYCSTRYCSTSGAPAAAAPQYTAPTIQQPDILGMYIRGREATAAQRAAQSAHDEAEARAELAREQERYCSSVRLQSERDNPQTHRAELFLRLSRRRPSS